MHRPIVAISTGDPCGIGPEITVKALTRQEVYAQCRPLIIADADVVQKAMSITGTNLKINKIRDPEDCRGEHGVLDILEIRSGLSGFVYGEISRIGGEASFQYIKRAIELALLGKVHATTTGPIHKEALNMAGHHYAGHTEIFANLTGTQDYCMMLIDKDFRVSHVTTHVALSQVPALVKKERVLKVIELTHNGLKMMGIERPRIGVAGLNPHAGDGGLFGREEIEEIGPAIESARQKGISVDGPISPDTVFVKLHGGQYDALVAMYHDQGHIPTKMVGFKYDNRTGTWGNVAGINITLGLPIIRTSVDHGVALDQAGKGTANPESMLDAIQLAAVLARHR